LFKEIVELIKNKAHLNIEGIQVILKIKASMNLGLSESIKSNFSKITPIIRPQIITKNIEDLN
jgi:hypothetical protein